MKLFSYGFKLLFAIALLQISINSYAVPTLNFGGGFAYTADPGNINPVDLSLTGSLLPGPLEGLSVTPDIATSSVSLLANFLSSQSTADTTTGIFGTTAFTDLWISDNSGARNLLSGNITTLTMSGSHPDPVNFIPGNIGVLEGTLEINGGVLAGDFGGNGSLFAFTFNIDGTVFNPAMFEGNFNSFANGLIEAVAPEPMPLVLLSIGLIGIALSRKAYKQ